jgi:protocatechuate 3,4-dioxygenase beta subunit
MLPILLGLLFTAALVAAQGASQSVQRVAEPTTAQPHLSGSISGTVKDAVTGAPLTGVVVMTVPSSQPPNGTKVNRVNATTDAEGSFRLSGLPPGRYRLLVRSADRFGPTASRIVTLRGNEHLASIHIALRPHGAISGKVLDDNKEPLPGTTVYAISKEYRFGRLEYLVKVGARSDDMGEYYLPIPEPGRAYLVRAERREGRALSDVPADPESRKPSLLPTYYPNSNTIEGAAPVVLRPGERREGVDIEMSRSSSFCIEGTLDADGSPTTLTFWVVEDALSASDYKLGGSSGPDGKMRVCGLQPGRYHVGAHENSPTPTGQAPRLGVSTVSITNKDVRNVTIVAKAAVPLAGRVSWDGTFPHDEPLGKVRISLEPVDRMYFMGEQTDAQCSVSGEFAFPGLLVGNYAVRVRGISSPGVYVKDILYSGRSIRNSLLRLGNGTGDGELGVILGRDGGTVSAKVVDRDGNPVPDSRVLIMPGKVDSDAELASALISGQTDQNGVYSSETLSPGKYYVLVSSAAVDSTPESIGMLSRSRLSKAREIEIGAGSTVQLTLTLATMDY